MGDAIIRPTQIFDANYYRETLDLSSARQVRALIRECDIIGLRGAQLINCTMTGSRVLVNDVRGLLGVTLTMDCLTFEDVEVPEILLDLLLYLLTRTRGNESKRGSIRALIDGRRVREFDKIFPLLET